MEGTMNPRTALSDQLKYKNPLADCAGITRLAGFCTEHDCDNQRHCSSFALYPTSII
jgi:hypothetical protein